MKQTVTALLAQKGISLCAPLSLADCTVTRPYLLDRVGIVDGTVFLFAVPYYTTECDDPARTISAYAVSRDYHLFMGQLFEEILPLLRERFPAHRFAGFTDHSPIAEVEAAVRAGLGARGRNGLFLTREHSSFVFLGEIVTDAILETDACENAVCVSCGACVRACPVEGDISRCLSALTQKKGTLTEEERTALLAHGCAWGCDICQNICPTTHAARTNGTLWTQIPFFKEKAIAHLTSADVRAMSDEEFNARAYSWRGRQTILRNLELLEKGDAT